MMRRGYRLLFKYDECRRPPKGRPRGGLMTKKIKKKLPCPIVPWRGLEAGVHRIMAIFMIPV